MSLSSPRPAAEILAEMQKLDRENDRLELHVALAQQQLKAAQAHATDAGPNDAKLDEHLTRAANMIRQIG